MVPLLISFSSGNISLICNLIFFAMLLLVVISCLVGMKKGLVKSTLKLVVWLILILFVYLNNVNFTKIIFNTDLTYAMKYSTITSFNVNNIDISLSQKIGDIIGDVLKAYDIGSSKEAVNALAMSILSFFVLIISLLSCLIISPIMTFIIYIIIVRPILKRMKKRKLRIAGLFVNATKTVLVSAAFLTPLFSVSEVLLRNYNDALEEGYEYDETRANEYWKIIYPIMNGYNNSLLHYTFSFITGQGRNNSFYTVKVENSETKVNFADLLGDVFSVACSTLSVAEDVSQSSLIAAMLTDHTLELLSTKVLNNAFLVDEVLPIIASISLNMIDDNSIISKEDAEALSEEIEFIDFGKDLSSYVELFRLLNENGYISEVILESKPYVLSKENQISINKGLAKFKTLQQAIKDSGKRTLLEVILPPVLASLVKNAKNNTSSGDSSSQNDFLTILPDNADDYRQYDIVDFVQVISDVLFNFNELYKATYTLDTINNGEVKQQIETIEDLDTSKINDLDAGRMLDIFFAEEIVSGENEFGIDTMSLFVGNGKENNRGLLDIPFMLDSMQGALDIALNMLKGGVISEESFNEIKAKLDEIPSTKESWNNEISSMFGFISKLYNKQELPILLKGPNGEIVMQEDFQIDLEKDSQLNVLKSAVLKIGNSKIIPAIIVPIIKEKVSINWDDIGVNVDDLNFENFTENNNLGTELIDLLDAFHYAMPLFNIDNNENIFQSNINSNDLELVFDCLLDCEIINPHASLIAKEHNVLRQIILKLFNDPTLQEIGISLPAETYDACESLDVEFSNICGIFAAVEEDDSLSTLLSQGNLSLDNLQGSSFSGLISAISESEFFRPCLGNILEKQLSPVLETSGINATYFDFKAIENTSSSTMEEKAKWKEEGNNIGELIDIFKKLGTGEDGFDFTAIIKNEENQENLKALLKSFVKMHFLEPEYAMENEKYDRLGLIIYDLLKEPLNEYLGSDSELQIKKDLSFAINDDNYKKIDGTKANDLSRQEKWNQELDKFADVAFKMADLQDENGNIVIDLTNDSELNKISKLLIGKNDNEQKTYGLNDVIFMRTIFANSVIKTLNEAFNSKDSPLNDLFKMNENITYAEAFNNEFNYQSSKFAIYVNNSQNEYDTNKLTTREIEASTRADELAHIFEIVENMDIFQGDSINIEECKLVLESTLINMHDSLTLHSPKLRNESANKDKLTIFERFILEAMDKLDLSEITYDKDIIVGYDSASAYMKNKILKISQNEQLMDDTGFSPSGVRQNENEFRSWYDEIESLTNFVKDDDINGFMTDKTYDKNDYYNLTDDGIITILKLFNESYLLHDGTTCIAKAMLESVNIEAYRIDEEEQSTEINYYIDKAAIYFDDNISIWDEEISDIALIKDSLIYEDASGKHFIDFENYDFASSNLVQAQKILPAIKKSSIIEPMFYDFIYKVFENGSVSSYVSSISDAPIKYENYSEQYNGDIYQDAKKKRDTIKFLGEERILPREAKLDDEITSWGYEGKFLDDALKNVLDNKNMSLENPKNDEIDNIVSLFGSSYIYNGTSYNYEEASNVGVNILATKDMVNEENYIRGYLMSEVMFNMFNEKAHIIGIEYLDEFAYDYKYNCFNDYEKDAMGNIFRLRNDFSEVTSLDDLYAKLDHNNFKKMGPGEFEDSTPRDVAHVLLSDGFNSRFACELINNYYLYNALCESEEMGPILAALDSMGRSLKDVFKTDGIHSIEYHAENIWKKAIQEKVSGGF